MKCYGYTEPGWVDAMARQIEMVEVGFSGEKDRPDGVAVLFASWRRGGRVGIPPLGPVVMFEDPASLPGLRFMAVPRIDLSGRP